jgi:hypothetical protein
MKLLKCICGRVAKIWVGEYGDELRIIECDCGISTQAWWDGTRCAMQWNAIQREKRKLKMPQKAKSI